MEEQRPSKAKVTGSIPVSGTIHSMSNASIVIENSKLEPEIKNSALILDQYLDH